MLETLAPPDNTYRAHMLRVPGMNPLKSRRQKQNEKDGKDFFPSRLRKEMFVIAKKFLDTDHALGMILRTQPY